MPCLFEVDAEHTTRTSSWPVHLGPAKSPFLKRFVPAGRFLHYFFGFDDGRCDRALPATDFDDLDVRRSWSAELAAEAALGDVALAGALRCDNALPAPDFDLVPVELDRNVEDAARPADVLVTLALAILASWLNVNRVGLV